MTPEHFGEAETALFNELVAGAIFDIIHAVHTSCVGWDNKAQIVMMEMIVQEIAIQWGLIDAPEKEDEEA